MHFVYEDTRRRSALWKKHRAVLVTCTHICGNKSHPWVALAHLRARPLKLFTDPHTQEASLVARGAPSDSDSSGKSCCSQFGHRVRKAGGRSTCQEYMNLKPKFQNFIFVCEIESFRARFTQKLYFIYFFLYTSYEFQPMDESTDHELERNKSNGINTQKRLHTGVPNACMQNINSCMSHCQ